MRRGNYAKNKDSINARKRELYAARDSLPRIQNFDPLSENRAVEVLRKESQAWINGLSNAEQVLWSVIDKRMQWNHIDGDVDIMVLSKGQLVEVRRYNRK